MIAMRKLFLFILSYFMFSFIFLSEISVADDEVVIDLAQMQISINTGFNGDELVIYGTRTKGDLAITIRGPDHNMIVRKKSKIMGMWVNTDSVEFNKVPVYYDYAIIGDETGISSEKILNELGIGIDEMDFSSDEDDILKKELFHEALIRIRQSEGLLPLSSEKIENITDDFFNVKFILPSNVPTGKYIVEAFLFNFGKLVDRFRKDFPVTQVGISAEIYKMAMEHSWLYGFSMVLFAVLMGWGSHMLFRRR